MMSATTLLSQVQLLHGPITASLDFLVQLAKNGSCNLAYSATTVRRQRRNAIGLKWQETVLNFPALAMK